MDWVEFLLFALLAGIAFAAFFFVFAFLYIYFAVEMDEEDERKIMRNIQDALGNMADKNSGILIAVMNCGTLCSCAARQSSMPSVLIVKDSVHIERVVPHPVDAKESSIEAWIECDQQGRALLTKIKELEDDKLSLSMSLDSVGKMLVKASTPPDTIWIRADSVIITKEIQVPYPVERELTRWEAVRMRLGDILLIIVNIGLIYVAVWLIKRRRKR